METHPGEEIPECGDDRWNGADLCVCCLAELEDGCATCRSCGAPVTPTEAISPWESTLARGFIFRRAIEQPSRPLVVAGVCILFAYFFLDGLWILYWCMFVRRMPIMYPLVGCLVTGIGAAGIWQCVTNYRRRRAEDLGEKSSEAGVGRVDE